MRPEQHPASNSNARKAHAEAADPHGGCKVGTCKAQDRWRRVSCAGGDGDVEAACEVMHDAYEAAAVEAGWETQQRSRVPWADVPEANKVTMRAAVTALLDHLAAQPVVPQPTEGAAEVVCTNCEADDLGCTACGAHGTLAARSQRPEGVTVTEWGLRAADGRMARTSEEAARQAAVNGGWTLDSSPIVAVLTRQRTTFPDAVTEWAEVPGETEIAAALRPEGGNQ